VRRSPLKLMAATLKATGVKTKREAVELGLKPVLI
jgi:Arc/MetJ family transcription regulator